MPTFAKNYAPKKRLVSNEMLETKQLVAEQISGEQEDSWPTELTLCIRYGYIGVGIRSPISLGHHFLYGSRVTQYGIIRCLRRRRRGGRNCSLS